MKPRVIGKNRSLQTVSASDSDKTIVRAKISPPRVVVGQAAEAVRDLALERLELPAGAASVTSKLIPLLRWGWLRSDSGDQVSGSLIIENKPTARRDEVSVPNEAF